MCNKKDIMCTFHIAHGLFRNYVYYHFIFPKLIKGGWKIFQKTNKRGGDDYSVLESKSANFGGFVGLRHPILDT